MADTLIPFAESVENDETFALVVIGAKLDVAMSNFNGDPAVHTFVNIQGSPDVVAEGLYAELAGQIEAGEFQLAAIVAEVVRDLQLEFNIDLCNLKPKSQKAKLYVVPKSDPTKH